MGLLDTLIECGQLCPHSLEIVIERVNELQRAGVGRSMPLAWSIGVVSDVLAEDWVDGEELVAVPNVASAAWTAGAKQDMLDSVLLSGVEVEYLECFCWMLGVACNAESGSRHLRSSEAGRTDGADEDVPVKSDISGLFLVVPATYKAGSPVVDPDGAGDVVVEGLVAAEAGVDSVGETKVIEPSEACDGLFLFQQGRSALLVDCVATEHAQVGGDVLLIRLP